MWGNFYVQVQFQFLDTFQCAAEGHRGKLIVLGSDNFKKSRGFQWALSRLVSQFPAQYFGKLPGFNL